MRNLVVLFLTFCITGVWAQEIPLSSDREVMEARKKRMEETPMRVRYVSNVPQRLSPLYYANGVRVGDTFLNTLNPEQIANINVVKEDTVWVDDTSYFGRVDITLKEGYQPAIISLSDLVKKNLPLDERPVLFMIDEKLIITDDYEMALVDENYILSIELEDVNQPKEKLNFWLVRLTTRSTKNQKVRGDQREEKRERPQERQRERSYRRAVE